MAEKKKEIDIIDQLQESIEKNKDTPEFKEHMKKLSKQVSDHQHSHDDAVKYGKKIGKNLIKKFSHPKSKKLMIAQGQDVDKYTEKDWPNMLATDQASSALASMFYHCHVTQQPSRCDRLLTEWTSQKMWGMIVMDFIPKLKEVWQYLHDNKYTKNNTLGYGDADGAIWVEYPKQLEEWEDKRKIIIHKSYCTCADDDTHIFILNDSDFGSLWDLLHVRTVWPRQNSRGGYAVEKSKKHPNGWFSWGDDRDIKTPSIKTYRDRNFKYSYQDGRDKGYTLTLKTTPTPSIDWAHIHQSRIEHAIWLIDQMKLITTDESYQCK